MGNMAMRMTMAVDAITKWLQVSINALDAEKKLSFYLIPNS